MWSVSRNTLLANVFLRFSVIVSESEPPPSPQSYSWTVKNLSPIPGTEFQYHQWKVEKDKKNHRSEIFTSSPAGDEAQHVYTSPPPNCSWFQYNQLKRSLILIKNNVSTAVLQLLSSPIFEGDKMNSLHCTPRFVQSRPEGESTWKSTGVTARLLYLFLHLLLNHLLLSVLLAFFLALILMALLAVLLAVQQETFPQAKSPPHMGEVSCTPPSSTNLQYIYALPLL